MPSRGLGLLPPTDERHLEKYPLTATTTPTRAAPVVVGSEWTTGMDEPVVRSDGSVWIRPTGAVRGGHAYCLEPEGKKLQDNPRWWAWYNQGNEGACVAFAISRMQSLHNRQRYAPWDLYREAQRIDEWPGEDYSGTSLRAGFDVAREQGLWTPLDGRIDVGKGPVKRHGIKANRWARDIIDIAYCLSPADGGRSVLNRGYVVVLNSWGDDPHDGFPHRTFLALEDLEQLVFRRNGEAGVVTDR